MVNQSRAFILGRNWLMIAVVLFSLGSLPAAIKSPRLLARIARETPQPRPVQAGAQLKAAEQDAATINGARAFWGVGQSMLPLFGPDTAVVVQPVAYDAIRRGMTVVYVKSDGRVVAHSVIGEDRKGYIVQGLNNDEADAESVNEGNLLGVVVAAYAPSRRHTSAISGFPTPPANPPAP